MSKEISSETGSPSFRIRVDAFVPIRTKCFLQITILAGSFRIPVTSRVEGSALTVRISGLPMINYEGHGLPGRTSIAIDPPRFDPVTLQGKFLIPLAEPHF